MNVISNEVLSAFLLQLAFLLRLSLSCLLSPQLAYLVVLTVNNSLYTQNDVTSPDYQLLSNSKVFPRKRRKGVRGNGGTIPQSGVGKASADTGARRVQITNKCRGSFQNGFRSSGRRIPVINLGVTSPIFIGRPIIDTWRRWGKGGGRSLTGFLRHSSRASVPSVLDETEWSG